MPVSQGRHAVAVYSADHGSDRRPVACAVNDPFSRERIPVARVLLISRGAAADPAEPSENKRSAAATCCPADNVRVKAATAFAVLRECEQTTDTCRGIHLPLVSFVFVLGGCGGESGAPLRPASARGHGEGVVASPQPLRSHRSHRVPNRSRSGSRSSRKPSKDARDSLGRRTCRRSGLCRRRIARLPRLRIDCRTTPRRTMSSRRPSTETSPTAGSR